MINIYIAAHSRAQRKQERIMCYILEAEVRGEPVTRSAFMRSDGTLAECELKALLHAVNRLKAPMDICVYADDDYLLVTMKHFAEIRDERFLKKDGSPLAHADLLKEISMKVVRSYSGTKHHSYENWMREEMEKRARDRINSDLAEI